RSKRDWSSDVCSSDLATASLHRSGFLDFGGRLADALTQVVELGAAHIAGALDFDFLDEGRMRREDALDALAVADATHGERLLQEIGRASCRERGDVWG